MSPRHIRYRLLHNVPLPRHSRAICPHPPLLEHPFTSFPASNLMKDAFPAGQPNHKLIRLFKTYSRSYKGVKSMDARKIWYENNIYLTLCFDQWADFKIALLVEKGIFIKSLVPNIIIFIISQHNSPLRARDCSFHVLLSQTEITSARRFIQPLLAL